MNPNTRIILASASPRRKQLLEQLGWHFDIVVPHVDENVLAGERPEEMVERLAMLKGQAIAQKEKYALVIASDTIVLSPEGTVFGKPKDETEAVFMLNDLAGRSHCVYSGLALYKGTDFRCGHAMTKVNFRSLSADDIAGYIKSGEWRGKAGGYAIQGRGSLLVDSLEGDYFSVVGLPLALLGHLLEGLGFSLSCMWGN